MRIIDADALIKELYTMYKSPTSMEVVGYDKAIADIVVTTYRQPTADVPDMKVGEWIPHPLEKGGLSADGIPRADAKQAAMATGIVLLSNSKVMILHADPEKIIKTLKKMEEETDAEND